MLLPNPTNKVGGSFILSLQKNCPMLVPNPTNEVGGLFILSLQRDWARTPPESHQRSWWIVHTQPTKGLGTHPSDRKSTRLNSSHSQISYAVFCLKKKKKKQLNKTA